MIIFFSHMDLWPSRMASPRHSIVATAARCSPCTPTPSTQCSPLAKVGTRPQTCRAKSVVYEHLRPYSLFASLEFIPLSICQCKNFTLFFLSGQLIPCRKTFVSAFTRSGAGVAAPHQPRFGEILSLTGSLILSLPKCRNSLCKWRHVPSRQ